MAYPHTLANGPGNLPDATQLMDNFNAAVEKSGDTMTGNLAFDNNSTHGLKGTATNDNAAAGNLGQVISSVFGPVSVATSGQRGDLTTITLTAGDWNAWGCVYLIPNGATMTGLQYVAAISGEAGNAYTNEVTGVNTDFQNGSIPTSFGQATMRVFTRVQSDGTNLYIAGNTTSSSQVVRLKFLCGTYTSGPPKASGILWARRVR